VPAASSVSAGTGGADDVDAVGGGLGRDAGLVTLPGDAVAGDAEDEVLGDLALADDLPGPQPDLVLAGELAGLDLGGDLAQVLFGGGQQVRALTGALGGQDGVAAGDQPLARVVRAGDLGQVLLAGQEQLQRGRHRPSAS
jgi:hypothetical protein